jgi:hypothetical protein
MPSIPGLFLYASPIKRCTRRIQLLFIISGNKNRVLSFVLFHFRTYFLLKITFIY